MSTDQKRNPSAKGPFRIALFDIGTNSIKFLIAEIHSTAIARRLYFSRATTRLGARAGRAGGIQDRALSKTIRAISTFQKEAHRNGCTHTYAFATHALRTAANANEAVAMIERKTGIHIRILTGGEEAFYAFTSARNRLKPRKAHTILLDIGGGSTEFVHASNDKIKNASSLPLGAIHLTEEFLRSDPVNKEEFNAMQKHIDRIVRRSRVLPNLLPEASAMDFVVSGGAIWTLAQMIYHAEGFRLHSTAVNRIKRHHLQSFLRRCLSLPLNERKQIEGLEPDRADIIVAGLAIVDHFMRKTNKRVLIANEGGVREGVLQAIIESDFQRPPQTDPMDEPSEGEPLW